MFEKHPTLLRVLGVIAAIPLLLVGILGLGWAMVFLLLDGPGGNLSLGESIGIGFAFLTITVAAVAAAVRLLRVSREKKVPLKQSMKAWLRIGAATLVVAVLAPIVARHARRAPSRPIEEYVSFLKKPEPTPVDYILGLFARHDIVIVCERFHPEATQYNLFYELASDPRFQEQVGHIFTELGTAALQPWLESFLTDEKLTEEEVKEKLGYVARNFCGYPVWDKSNFFEFLTKVYYLNRSLPKERRVHVYPTDIEFSWDTATKDSFAEYSRKLGQRDKIEAENVISKFKVIRQSVTRNKALVIMNYRHACPHLTKNRFEREENTGGFLMEAFPGRVANVMLNSVRLLPGSTEQRAVITALHGGQWDAAFALAGNPRVGFDFQRSPFGADRFDYWLFPTQLRYQDVFTGFVFYEPLQAHRLSFGLPGLIDESFADELLRRYRITGENRTRDEVAREIMRLEMTRVSSYEDDTNVISRCDCAKTIRRWLKARP